MNIQPNDTLLAIYHLTNAQDKADAIDKLPDNATIPLEDVLVMTHKAVLLEVTDVRLGGYTAKSIPFRSDESAVEYVSTDGVLTPRSSELALEDVEGQPFIINLGKPLSEETLTHEMLTCQALMPDTMARMLRWLTHTVRRASLMSCRARGCPKSCGGLSIHTWGWKLLLTG